MPPRRISVPALLIATAVLMAACGSSGTPRAKSSSSSSITSSVGSEAGGSGSAGATLWLCRPGTAPDPCESGRSATAVTSGGAVQPVAPPSASNGSRVDCFYVYPTVVAGPGDNAPLSVEPAITAAAVAQASRFSSVCNVWAPVYRQRTSLSLVKGLGGDPAADAIAYASLLSAWKDYLAHDNDGRPIVFIGHSQGAAMLIRLLRSQVDTVPSVRRLMVSAIILGGNVQVGSNGVSGGAFQNLPACRSTSQTGCIIAYSSFPSEPPADSNFGRPGQGVSLQSEQTTTTGQSVLCTNPASLGGGSGALEPYFPVTGGRAAGQAITTPWVVYPGLYQAQCESAGGATWLQVTAVAGSSDPAPRVTESLGPTWGFHVDDVNLALGNLVSDVAAEEAAFKPAT